MGDFPSVRVQISVSIYMFNKMSEQQQQHQWLDQKDDSPFPQPSLKCKIINHHRLQHKPYEILVREAIRRTQESNCGSNRHQMLKYILCKYKNLKYVQTKKALSKCLRRMMYRGYIKQSKPGVFHMTHEGRALIWTNGVPFDRSVCGQQRLQMERKEAKRKAHQKLHKIVKKHWKPKSIPWRTPFRRIKKGKRKACGIILPKTRKSPEKKCPPKSAARQPIKKKSKKAKKVACKKPAKKVAVKKACRSKVRKNVGAKPKRITCKPKKVARKTKKVACKPKKVACKPKKVACKPKKVVCKPKKVACKPKKVECKPKKVECKK